MKLKRKHRLTIALVGLCLASVVYIEMVLRPHSTYVVYEAYYKCESRKGLEGGIYGKGPIKKFGPRYCTDWAMITRTEFKSLTTT